MTDFVSNGASELPGVKQDARAPTGAATEWASDDSNKVRQALLDLRTAALGVQTWTVSADNGDTSPTLTVGSSAVIQRFATALGANRTVTLSTTGAANGDTFRIVRTGLGAFTLNVGGLKTIPSATAAFVDVAYDGSTWRLTGYGTL